MSKIIYNALKMNIYGDKTTVSDIWWYRGECAPDYAYWIILGKPVIDINKTFWFKLTPESLERIKRENQDVQK